MNSLIAFLEIVQTSYNLKTVAWFGGDGDDPPGWRAYLVDPSGALVCPAAPPRLTREMAQADLQFCYFNNCGTYAMPYFNPPAGWPGWQYGKDPEDCGLDSIFGMDIPECDAVNFKLRVLKMKEMY